MGATHRAVTLDPSRCGLRPGVRLRIHGGGRAHPRVAYIAETTREGIVLDAPRNRSQRSSLAEGETVYASYEWQGERWSLLGVVESPGDASRGAVLSPIVDVRRDERRRWYRLPVSLVPDRVCRLRPKAPGGAPNDITARATVVELSAGGVRLSGRVPVASGERLAVEFTLPRVGQIQAETIVTRVDAPEPPRLNYKLACEFTRIAAADREAIAQFVLGRQLEVNRNLGG